MNRRRQTNGLHRTPGLRLGCMPDVTGAGSVSRSVRRNRAMWEEDPSYQNSNFRFLVGTVLCALLAGPIVAQRTQKSLVEAPAGVTVWPGA